MDVLSKPHVHMKNKDDVYRKIKSLVDGGFQSLQVISDYDMTLSRFSYNGKRCPSCHGILESSFVMSKDVKDHLQELKTKYYAIEIDHTMSTKEKIPYMIEWWGKAHEIMVEAKIKQNDIKEAVKQSTARFREGCNETFHLLNEQSVPLLIFSAGVGDVIEEMIKQRSTFYPNMKVVSNFMKFDSDGVMVGFGNEMIHIFNKNEGALCHSEYFNKIRHRHNILLLGDSPGDLAMADGVEAMSTCLKIGFLNDKVPERLDSYLDAWDIVLVKDPTMDVVNALLELISE